MKPKNTIAESGKDSLIEDAIICGVLTAALYLMFGMSGCGVSTPGGYVAGTVGYLETYNQGMLPPSERKVLR